MNIQNEINDDIKFLAKSEIRLKILSELYKRPDDIKGLVKKTKITYSSVSSNVNKFMSFKTTKAGGLTASRFLPLIKLAIRRINTPIPPPAMGSQYYLLDFSFL